MVFSLENIRITENIVSDAKYKYIFSVEEVNAMVQSGVPFRDAYKVVGEKIQNGEFKPNLKVNHTHIGSVGNLGLERIKAKMEGLFS